MTIGMISLQQSPGYLGFFEYRWVKEQARTDPYPVELDDDLAGVSEMQSAMRRSIERMAKSQLANSAQVEIVRELLYGRRTVAELTEAIYHTRQGDAGYSTQYSRIRKELRELESKGLVVRRLFGRDKPYKLTQLAVQRLAPIGEHTEGGPGLVSKWDLALFLGVMVLGLSGLGSIWILNAPTPNQPLSFTFVFLGGVAFCRFLQILRKVI